MIETKLDRFGERFDDGFVELARMDVRHGPDPDDVWRYRRVMLKQVWETLNPETRRTVKEFEQKMMHDAVLRNIQRMEEHLSAKNQMERIKETLPPIFSTREKP